MPRLTPKKIAKKAAKSAARLNAKKGEGWGGLKKAAPKKAKAR